MKTCLNCKHWDFEGCPLKEDYTTQYDTCDQHEKDTVFIWGVFYSFEGRNDIVYDAYKTKEEAEGYALILAKQGMKKVYVKNICEEEDEH